MADLKISVDMKDIPAAVQATQRFERQINTLAAQLARGSITTGTYQKALNQLSAKYRKLGVDVSSARSAVMSYGRAAAEAAREQQALMGATQGATRGLNRAGVAMQQTGYQVGDFLVQIQSGTNAFVAFGQQATQMAGLLTLSMNPKMIALGAALSIAIPLATALGAAFMRTRQGSEEAAEGVKELEEELASLDNTLREYLRTREAARMGITAEELLGIEGLEEARERLRNSVQDVRDFIQAQYPNQELSDSFISRLALESEDYVAILGQLITAETRLANLRRMEGERQFRTFSDRLTQYQEEIELQQTIQQFGEDSDQARQVRLEQAIAAEFRRIDALLRASRITEAQAVALKNAAEEAERLAAVDMQSGIDAAADAASRLADNLAFARSLSEGFQANAVRAGVESGAIPPQALEDLPQTDADRAYQQLLERRRREARREATARAGSAGGGGGGTPEFVSRVFGPELQAAIEQAQEDLRLYNQEVSMLDSALRAGLITQQEYNSFVTQAQEAYNQAATGAYDYQAALEQVEQTTMTSMENAFMSILDGSKSAADAFKDMARQILAEAMRMMVIRPLIQGLFGGGGGGGFLGGIFGARASGGTMMAGEPYLVGERGPELVMPSRSGTVMNADLTRKATGGGETIVVNQTINVSTGVQQTVRNEIKQLMPQISESAKQAVVDAKRRGGSYGRAFA